LQPRVPSPMEDVLGPVTAHTTVMRSVSWTIGIKVSSAARLQTVAMIGFTLPVLLIRWANSASSMGKPTSIDRATIARAHRMSL